MSAGLRILRGGDQQICYSLGYNMAIDNIYNETKQKNSA